LTGSAVDLLKLFYAYEVRNLTRRQLQAGVVDMAEETWFPMGLFLAGDGNHWVGCPGGMCPVNGCKDSRFMQIMPPLVDHELLIHDKEMGAQKCDCS
jgi:hypothetical protein